MTKLNNVDIGRVGIEGTMKESDNNFIIMASGKDIWDYEDEGHFAYLEHEGDFDIVVRIKSLTMANLYTKAGIMARDTLESDSRNVFLVAFGDNGPRRNNNGGCEFQYRTLKGGESLAIYPAEIDGNGPLCSVDYPNVWLRLNRTGDEFKAYFSNDGSQWLEYCKHNIVLNTKLLVGVCATSHNEQQSSEFNFSDLRFI